MSVKPRAILVADPDSAFLDPLLKDPKAARVPVAVAKLGSEAVARLTDVNQSFAGIFINPEIKKPDGISVIRYAHQYRPAAPIYLIHNGECPFTKEQLERLGVHRALAKPIHYDDMVDLVVPSVMGFDPNRVLEQAKKNHDSVDTEVTAEDSQFLPIIATDFLSGAKSFFDVYVRLASGKYVKILQSGDAFSLERVSNYLKKGVTHFYLRKEAQELYLGYCDQLAGAVLANAKIQVEVKTKMVFAHGEQAAQFLKTCGLSEANLQHATSFVENAHSLVKQIDPEKNNQLKSFVNNLAAYEHGVACTMVASILEPLFNISAEKTVQIVGMACMLHDIGLYQLPPELHTEDESKMSPEQLKLYQTHPALSAKVLSTIHGIDPASLQAVTQHHERRTKRGFPVREGHSPLNRVGEIVGIADEFVRLMHRVEGNPNINLRREMEWDIFNGFSYPVCQAFKQAFSTIF